MVQKGLRPSIPPGTPGPLAAVMTSCWVRDPDARPSFEQLREQLEEILEGARAEDMRRQNAGTSLCPLASDGSSCRSPGSKLRR